MSLSRRWKISLVLVAIFVAGAISGSVLTIITVKRFVDRGRGPEIWTGAMMRLYKEELQLTPEQEAHLRPMMEEAGRELHVTRQHAIMESGFVIRRMNDAIEKELTPEQKVRFDKLRAELRARLHNTNAPPSGPFRNP